MARSTTEIVRHFLAAFYAGDLEAALALCHDDIDFMCHAPVDLLPHLDRRRGKAQLEETWRTLHARYAEMRHEAPFLAAEGDRAAARIRIFFRKRGNDRVLSTDIADFYRFRDGLIVEIRQFIDSFDAVEQVLERDIAGAIAAHRLRERLLFPR
jgi:ketosteroid isomerase-like protein